MDEDLSVDEVELEDAPDVQFSTGEFTKYEITEPGVLDCCQRLWKRKCKICPVSDGNSNKSSIKDINDVTILWDCGLTFSFPASERVHVCKGFTSSNCSFGAIIPQVAAELIKLGTIMMENVSKVDVMNIIPLREEMESLSISN